MTPLQVVVASHYRLPVKGYGGTERVVVALVRGLAALGHRVTLLASPGTRVPEATGVEVPPDRIRDPALDLATLLPPGADILHAIFPVRRVPSHPFVQTLEGNLTPGSPALSNNICVSRDHARRHGTNVFVYNGLDPADFIFRAAKDDYDLFLGRLHSVKGYRWAVAAAKHSGRRLLIAGGWRPSLRRNIRYVGEVDGRRKAELLAGARCLWMPALWDEPFGLTLIEALFSGTPVLATRRGALPEVSTPEVGALCDTLDEMIAAAETIHARDPHACRAQGAGAIRELGHAAIQYDLPVRREVARDIGLGVRELRRSHGGELEHPHVRAGPVARGITAVPEVLVDIHAHPRARQRAHESVTVHGAERPTGPPRDQPDIRERAHDWLADVVAGPHEHERSRPAPVPRRGRRPQVLGVAAKREIVGPCARRSVARETRAIMREEAVVRRRQPGGRLVIVRVVGEPIDPAAAEPTPELADIGRRKVRPLEDQHDVGGLAPQLSGEAAYERAPEDRVPAAAPLLAAPHLAAQGGEGSREGQTTSVIAAVERRDEHYAQPSKGERGARSHTST